MFFSKRPAKDTTKAKQNIYEIKDLLAPSYVEVDFNHIQVDGVYYKSLFVIGYPRFVHPNWLSALINFDHSLTLSMYVYPTDSNETLEDLKKKIAEMQATISSDEDSGKPADPKVEVALGDALLIQGEIAEGTERLFQLGLYITVQASSLAILEKKTNELESLLSSLWIITKQATLEMEEGYKSTLPLFSDKLGVWKNMDTTSLSYAFPFSSSSLTQETGVFYGINQHDNSLVIFDRFSLETANTAILGKSGGGKSFMVKLEALRLLLTGTDVIIIDPENEYEKVAYALQGEFLSFSLHAGYHINPFDFNDTEKDASELSNKILNLHSLCKVIIGDISPIQDALLDKALVETYRSKGITQDPETFKNTPPLLEDLYKILMGVESPEAQQMAYQIEKFIKGSAQGIFNSPSNFDISNSCTVFGIRDLEENIRPVAMYILLDFVWNKIRKDKKRRILIVDEAWYLIKNKDSASYMYNFAKRARKYNLGLTTITQDIGDFLTTEEGKAILSNTSVQILLKQSQTAIDQLATVFDLSVSEKHSLITAGIGEGLFFAGQKHVPIRIIASDYETALIS
jgi:conjugal transfer ATP-binding protein TraC